MMIKGEQKQKLILVIWGRAGNKDIGRKQNDTSGGRRKKHVNIHSHLCPYLCGCRPLGSEYGHKVTDCL